MRSPVLDDCTANRQFKRKNEGPLHDIVPTHGETPRRINKSVGIAGDLLAHVLIGYWQNSRIETTRDGIHDSKLTESIDNVEDHDTHDQETNSQ